MNHFCFRAFYFTQEFYEILRGKTDGHIILLREIEPSELEPALLIIKGSTSTISQKANLNGLIRAREGFYESKEQQ